MFTTFREKQERYTTPKPPIRPSSGTGHIIFLEEGETLPPTPKLSQFSSITITNISSTTSSFTVTVEVINTLPILEAGTVYSTTTPVNISNNPLSYNGSVLDGYEQTRTSLSPQTRYYVAAYKTTSASTTLSNQVTTYTLSNKPITQAVSLYTIPLSSEEIDISWISADFPTTGATNKRYLLLRANAPNMPVFTGANANGPTVDANTTIVNADISYQSNFAPARGLTALTEYNFLLIPFCWDGVNPETYNYLIENAPTASGTTNNLPGAIISNPTVTTITNSSAVLGATINSDPGGSGILERGTIYSTSSPVTINNNSLSEGGTGLGVFSQIRYNLTAQTKYYYTGYAITNDAAISIGDESSFWTLSNPPTNQPTNLQASVISTSEIDLTWTQSNVFPTVGATFRGYLLLSAIYPNVPNITNSKGQAPVADSNTTIFTSITGPNATSYNVTGLASGTHYNFKLIPYTWNATNTETYNYLTAGALVVDATTL
jgi:hypothetical protein